MAYMYVLCMYRLNTQRCVMICLRASAIMNVNYV